MPIPETASGRGSIRDHLQRPGQMCDRCYSSTTADAPGKLGPDRAVRVGWTCLPDESRRFRTLSLVANVGESRETRGIAEGCSRLFPAVLGTRDRKRTAEASERDRRRAASVFGSCGTGLFAASRPFCRRLPGRGKASRQNVVWRRERTSGCLQSRIRVEIRDSAANLAAKRLDCALDGRWCRTVFLLRPRIA